MNTWKRKGILILVLAVLIGAIVGLIKEIFIIKNKMQHEIESQKALVNENIKLFQVMSEWMKAKTNNRTISDYLTERGYQTIAIYGMGRMGDCLLNELCRGNVSVKYAIDRNVEEIYARVDLYKPSDDIPDVDAILITDITIKM